MDTWWLLSTKELITRIMKIENPNIELIKIVDSLVDKYLIDTWYFLGAIPQEDLMFVINNYIPLLKEGDKLNIGSIQFFCLNTKHLSSTDRREALRDYFTKPDGPDIKTLRLEDILSQYDEKDKINISDLDFLEGKITTDKMINWAVGQVMKTYPKKYDPKDVKEAIMNRWNV